MKSINKIDSEKNDSFNFIDTFAGCGGLRLGMISSGFTPVLINEIEPRYLETYYFNHSLSIEKYHCSDISELVKNESKLQKKYNNIDLVVGGPPCQGFSMANRQRIIDEPRNSLYKHFLELLSIIRPKFFVMENVKGMMKKADEILNNYQTILGKDYWLL